MPNKHIPRLRQERERRGWSREYVAEQIKVDVVTVGRWERGERLPHPVYRQQLCDFFEMNAEHLGLFMAESSQENDEKAIDLDYTTPKDVFSGKSEPQASDIWDTRSEKVVSSHSTFAPPEEITKEKTSGNPWSSSRLAHMPKRNLYIILAIILLVAVVVVTVLGARSLTSSPHTVTSFHFIYTNGTLISKNCTYQEQGSIIAPYAVANSCSVRVWLYENDHQKGRALCLNPGMTSGPLKPIWVYFWVSNNSNVC